MTWCCGWFYSGTELASRGSASLFVYSQLSRTSRSGPTRVVHDRHQRIVELVAGLAGLVADFLQHVPVGVVVVWCATHFYCSQLAVIVVGYNNQVIYGV